MISPFIDAHVHLNTASLEKMELALEYGASFLSINTDIPFFISLEEQREKVVFLMQKYPDRVRFITSFGVSNWDEEGWLASAMLQIKSGLELGAVGVKIWKNIGMDLRDVDGSFVMVDDYRFDPIFDYLEKNNILVVGHLGEPKNCWLPLEEMNMDSDRNYFSAHPEYHMHLHPEYPTYAMQLEARDNRLKRHPDLKFVGLHLASLEWSVKEIGLWLDKFPNAMVDMAERICHLQYQSVNNWEEVRAFMIKYQDRIIYGTDVIDDKALAPSEIAIRFKNLWEFHWDYFSKDQMMKAPEFKDEFLGLKLPKEVLKRVFYENAHREYGFNPNY